MAELGKERHGKDPVSVVEDALWKLGDEKPECRIVIGNLVAYMRGKLMSAQENNAPHVAAHISEAAGPTEMENTSLDLPLSALQLSVRAKNCLEEEGITQMRELVIRSDEELMEIRRFGDTNLREVKKKLAEIGLRLCMRLPVAPSSPRLQDRGEVGVERCPE